MLQVEFVNSTNIGKYINRINYSHYKSIIYDRLVKNTIYVDEYRLYLNRNVALKNVSKTE